MKRIALGILLSTSFSMAHAGVLTVTNVSGIEFSGYNGEPAAVAGVKKKGYVGTLEVTSAGTFSATYLGSESGYANLFTLAGAGSLIEFDPLGRTVSTQVQAGVVNFSFSDSRGATFSNGMVQNDVLGYAVLSGKTKAKAKSYGSFDYILGFNDSYGGDADYDDFVVGVKFVSAPVPEAETYSMMLAGIGLIGFMAGRRKEKQS